VCANERTSGVHAARHGPWTGLKGLDRMRYRKFENYCSGKPVPLGSVPRGTGGLSRVGDPCGDLDSHDWDPR